MTVFKYFTNIEHAVEFAERGIMLLRPLSHFRAYEDEGVRGDPRDGLLNYEPDPGLQITRQDGATLIMEGWRFTSSARHDDIFVYCASNVLSSDLAHRFNSRFCVEVDQARLLDCLRARAHPTSRLDYKGLVAGSVNYRNPSTEPGIDWALPERLALIKPEQFCWQDEFRVAIPKRGAFGVENVVCSLERGSPTLMRSTENELFLRISGVSQFCRMHKF